MKLTTIWIDKKHRVVPLQIAGLWRYYPQYTRGRDRWHYYQNGQETPWFVMPESAVLWFRNRGIGSGRI